MDAMTLVLRARYLLLDFDGPVCAVFSGLTARQSAERLRDSLALLGVNLPDSTRSSCDPLEIFRHVASAQPQFATVAHEALTKLELEAVMTATPTPWAEDVISATVEAGQAVGIVSNNSVEAIQAYLSRHQLTESIFVIAARSSADPSLMKPSPYLVRLAIEAAGGIASQGVLVGDSVSDIEAGKAASVPTIGYANKAGKAERLSSMGADAIVTTMASLIARL
jgi:HAD superfamily hydrolase (TIGR01549 family)